MFIKKRQSGFSLIEMIVSLGVFAVVVTIAVGALLAVIATNRQLQAEQSIMTTLAFAMDSMTREMRTGYYYYCDSSPSGGIFYGSNEHEDLDKDTQDCASGNTSSFRFQGVSFFEGGDSITGSSGSSRILYFYDTDTNKLFRRIGDNTPQSIVSSGLEIMDAQFFVTGSESLDTSDTDVEQPTITIHLRAKEKDNPTGKVYNMQTTVTQRILDI